MASHQHSERQLQLVRSFVRCVGWSPSWYTRVLRACGINASVECSFVLLRCDGGEIGEAENGREDAVARKLPTGCSPCVPGCYRRRSRRAPRLPKSCRVVTQQLSNSCSTTRYFPYVRPNLPMRFICLPMFARVDQHLTDSDQHRSIWAET